VKRRYEVIIVLPDGHEFAAESAPCFACLHDASYEAFRLSRSLAQLGDPASVIIRDRLTREIWRRY